MDLLITFLLRLSVIKVRIKGEMQEDFNKSNCRHICKCMDMNYAYKLWGNFHFLKSDY